MATNSTEETEDIAVGRHAGRILVTGANGQLGMELRDVAPHFSQYDFVFLGHKELPVHDTSAVKEAFKLYQPQYCINCAAYTAVDKAQAEAELAFLVNGNGPGVIASACKDHGTLLVHISTDYVFDGASTTPYNEQSPVKPLNVYGASKLEGENMSVSNNPATIIIRTSWVYSAHGKNFVKTMMKLMAEKDELSVVNDQFGSPTYAGDLARCIMQIIGDLPTNDSRLWKVAGIYHYSNDGIITWFDFATAIQEIASSTCRINPIPTSQYPTPADRPRYSVMDKTRIKDTFGIPICDWRDSLTKCIRLLETVAK